MSEYLGIEKTAVQEPLINYVSEPSAEYMAKNGDKFYFSLGWEYLLPDDCLRMRAGKTGIILREIFINQFQKLNPGVDHLHAQKLIKDLENVPARLEGNQIVWEYLKGLRTVFIDYEKRERNLKLIDTDNIERNLFHVTDEFVYSDGFVTNRIDVVFFINGIPVYLGELKAANKADGIFEALKQITRYHRESPQLLAMVQVYALSHLIKFYYSATWNTTNKLLYDWKNEASDLFYDDIQRFEALVKAFFDKKRVVKVITDYLLFTREDDKPKKVILRPHQMRAVERIIQRASSGEKKRGLIWHTQGSGKTFTMIVAAEQLITNPLFENPTIILLVDRNELEAQLFQNLIKVGKEDMVVARSKRDLQNHLKADKRGIIISLIQKFDDIPENINSRKHIFILVDEAHRTTGGKLGTYLMAALPNATLIGFTGTPVDKSIHGQGTFITFGKDDQPQGYLDKYGIKESIEEGTTLKLHYSLAKNDLLVDKETLEREFLGLAESEGVSDIDELNRLLEDAVTLKTMLKNRDRIQKVTFEIVTHYREKVEPLGYKAFIVAVDREACALYKQELDKYFRPDESEVIISPGQNDTELLKKYHKSEDEEKQIRKAFRMDGAEPKFLIVTEKLLTGFDSPILYCMYLDKPMRDHVLLQAIARVNRPYEDEGGRKKPCGFVLDFVGIFENLQKALAFDSQDIEGIIEDIEKLKSEFLDLIVQANEYIKVIENKKGDKAVESLLEYFLDIEPREEFYNFYREISSIYDIISPDEFLRPYISVIETLTRMYKILKEAFELSTKVNKELSQKTIELVKKDTKNTNIQSSLHVYEIDEKTLQLIEENKASDTEKVFNLIKSIVEDIDSNVLTEPYLVSIGEKATNIAEQFKGRQNNTQFTLEKLKELVVEINEARRERVEKAMSKEIFSVFWTLKKAGIVEPEEKALNFEKVIKDNPNWFRIERQEREIRQALYKIVLSATMNNIPESTKLVTNIIDTMKAGKHNDAGRI